MWLLKCSSLRVRSRRDLQCVCRCCWARKRPGIPHPSLCPSIRPSQLQHLLQCAGQRVSRAPPCSTAQEDGRQTEGQHRTEGDKGVSSAWSGSFYFWARLVEWVPYTTPSLEGIQVFVRLLEKQPAHAGRDEQAWPSAP